MGNIKLAVSHEAGDQTKPYFATAEASFPSLELAKEFATSFPKTYRVKTEEDFNGSLAYVKVDLQPTKGNARNDAGVKRLTSFLQAAERRGYTVELVRGTQPDAWGTYSTLSDVYEALGI